ncbi:MAG: hypothetical protein J0L57_01860 [Burkholderiales bacterium]|nr:hypothetical protein [Burkholderiales bacterium]
MATKEQTLHRQVHPSWVQGDRITSQAFSPTPKDAGLLSVYDGRQIAAGGSFNHYTTVLNLTAIGTVSVAESEVTEVGLPWRPDPAPFPEHAVIDFTGVPSAGKVKAKAQALAEKARQRGWSHKP